MKSLWWKNLTNLFVSIWPNLNDKISQSNRNLKSNLPTGNPTLNETVLSEDKIKESFKLFKRNKAPGHDSLDVNIIPSVYEFIKKPLLKVFKSFFFKWFLEFLLS